MDYLEKKAQEEAERIAPTVNIAQENIVKKSKVSQCSMDGHEWRKLSENEVQCILCPTALIIEKEDMSNYVK